MEELNAAGGVNGGEVSIALGDDLGDPKEAVLVAQKFIDDTEIVVVDGHQFSGATIAAGRQVPARRPHDDHAVGDPAGHHRHGRLHLAHLHDRRRPGQGPRRLQRRDARPAEDRHHVRQLRLRPRPRRRLRRGRQGRRRHRRGQGAVHHRRHRLQGPAHQDQGRRPGAAVPLGLLPRGFQDRPAGQGARHGRADARLRRLRLRRAAQARRRRRRGHAGVHLLRLHQGRPGRAEVRRRLQGQVRGREPRLVRGQLVRRDHAGRRGGREGRQQRSHRHQRRPRRDRHLRGHLRSHHVRRERRRHQAAQHRHRAGRRAW